MEKKTSKEMVIELCRELKGEKMHFAKFFRIAKDRKIKTIRFDWMKQAGAKREGLDEAYMAANFKKTTKHGWSGYSEQACDHSAVWQF